MRSFATLAAVVLVMTGVPPVVALLAALIVVWLWAGWVVARIYAAWQARGGRAE